LRRLLAIVLMLWLPLQATGALAIAACDKHDVSHLLGQAAQASASALQHQGHEVSGHGASVEFGVMDASAPVGHHGTHCVVSCAVFVTMAPLDAAIGPAADAHAAHATAAFAAAPPNRIHRPPIAAAA
jgi:hypothetical protein